MSKKMSEDAELVAGLGIGIAVAIVLMGVFPVKLYKIIIGLLVIIAAAIPMYIKQKYRMMFTYFFSSIVSLLLFGACFWRF